MIIYLTNIGMQSFSLSNVLYVRNYLLVIVNDLSRLIGKRLNTFNGLLGPIDLSVIWRQSSLYILSISFRIHSL